MSIVRFDTEQRYVRPGRPAALTRDQVIRRRNGIWLNAVEVGMHDAATGRDRIHSRAELAALWAVSIRTVQEGLTSARKLRGEIDDGV